MADVEAIEWSLKKITRKGKKSTPTQAMCHMVARQPKHHGPGIKTVEKIWGEYVKANPEWSAKKTKTSTTPVAERTA